MAEHDDPSVLFAAERTMLAWNRTSLALLAFGFLIERAGLLLSVLAPDRSEQFEYTFWLGIAFIALGSVSAAWSTWQYAKVLKTLRPGGFPDGYQVRWGMVVNNIVAILGLILIAALYLMH